MKQYIITIKPDTEWAGIQAGPFSSKRAALESANEQEVLQPDCHGNKPNPSIVLAETPNCTCYGRWCCSACALAQIDGKLSLGKRGKYSKGRWQTSTVPPAALSGARKNLIPKLGHRPCFCFNGAAPRNQPNQKTNMSKRKEEKAKLAGKLAGLISRRLYDERMARLDNHGAAARSKTTPSDLRGKWRHYRDLYQRGEITLERHDELRAAVLAKAEARGMTQQDLDQA